MSTIADSSLDVVRVDDAGARRRRILRKTASYTILIIFGVIYVAPLLMLVFASFKSLPEFFANPTGVPEGLEWSNYSEAWSLANFPGYLINSLIYTVVATTLFVIMSVFVAFPIARGYVRGAGGLLMLYVVALFLPPALIPQFQLILNIGGWPVIGEIIPFLGGSEAQGLFNTRTGYIMLFLLVLVLGMVANFVVTRRERKYLG